MSVGGSTNNTLNMILYISFGRQSLRPYSSMHAQHTRGPEIALATWCCCVFVCMHVYVTFSLRSTRAREANVVRSIFRRLRNQQSLACYKHSCTQALCVCNLWTLYSGCMRCERILTWCWWSWWDLLRSLSCGRSVDYPSGFRWKNRQTDHTVTDEIRWNFFFKHTQLPGLFE